VGEGEVRGGGLYKQGRVVGGRGAVAVANQRGRQGSSIGRESRERAGLEASGE
jgi:hypothetical protein